MENIPMGAGGERFTREEIERVWRRVMPGGDPREVADLLSDGEENGCGCSPDHPGFCAQGREEFPMYADIPPKPEAEGFPPCAELPRPAEIREAQFVPDAPKTAREEMRLLIGEELERAVYYCALRDMARGRGARRDLEQLARTCYKNAKTLSTALFIQSGELWFPMEREPYRIASEYLDALRESFRAERYLAERYDALAAEAADGAVAETAEDLTATHRAAALTLRDIIEACVQ